MGEESYHKKVSRLSIVIAEGTDTVQSSRMFHIGIPKDVRSITLSIKIEA